MKYLVPKGRNCCCLRVQDVFATHVVLAQETFLASCQISAASQHVSGTGHTPSQGGTEKT